MTPWTDRAAEHAWLAAELARLLDFGMGVADPDGGSRWLDDHGRPDPAAGIQTWITTRMVHVYALAHLLGRPGAADVAGGALAGLTESGAGRLRDHVHGGWHPLRTQTGAVAPGKYCYDHVFVVLAGASATVAGLHGGPALLDEALAVLEQRFWDDDAGLLVDGWDTAWTRLDDYRGLNGNMHGVEALMAASDAIGDPVWRNRALRIAAFVVDRARAQDWRIPEHYDRDWQPLLDYNAGHPSDRFKPYGATIGHGLEWSRLLLHLEAGLGAGAPDWLLTAAAELFSRAVADGWAADGAEGFVYTTDWAGQPVVRDRLHWVVAEGISTASALHRRTADPSYIDWYDLWWDYADRHLIDREAGSWRHQLDAQNRPASTVWSGKPDLYHAVQATLIPRLPLAPVMASALAHGLAED